MGEIGLDEVEDLGDERPAHRIGDLGSPDELRGEQAHKARGALAIPRGKVGTRELWQDLLGWTVKYWRGVEDHPQDRQVLTQHGLEECLFRRKIPVDKRLRAELGTLCDALDGRATKAMLRELVKGGIHDLLPAVLLLSCCSSGCLDTPCGQVSLPWSRTGIIAIVRTPWGIGFSIFGHTATS